MSCFLGERSRASIYMVIQLWNSFKEDQCRGHWLREAAGRAHGTGEQSRAGQGAMDVALAVH